MSVDIGPDLGPKWQPQLRGPRPQQPTRLWCLGLPSPQQSHDQGSRNNTLCRGRYTHDQRWLPFVLSITTLQTPRASRESPTLVVWTYRERR